VPKRNAIYMESQRDTIARAALETLLKKGFDATSLRDVCKVAGVSMGALYIHFANKHDLVIAACMLPLVPDDHPTPAQTWAEYEREFLKMKPMVRSDRTLRRLRLSLQFAAHFTLAPESPTGFIEIWERGNSWFRDSLDALHRRGEIDLPLGLETTARLHSNLLSGTTYMLAYNKGLDLDATWGGMVAGLAQMAGARPKSARRPVRRPRNPASARIAAGKQSAV
jgi:AcrR family transcriptional regulator